MRAFASDNYAGVLPEVLDAIARVNAEHEPAYGADAVTARVAERFRAHFGPDADAYLVFNGTGANVTAMRALCRPWEGVVCAESAHLNADEGGAPEHAGIKLLTVAAPDGKLTPELVAPRLVRFDDEHAVQPKVISISQSTELGTLYGVAEVRALADLAHAHGMLLHVDGSRLTNAAEALGVPFAEVVSGADAVSFGGTKAGLMVGEAVVFLRPGLGEATRYLRKQSMQLASKMRFLAVQFEALLSDDELWRRGAANANAMARRLAGAVSGVEGVTISQAVQANAVFAVLPPGVAERLQADWRFYTWDESAGEVRWMCSWDTTAADVDAFADAIRTAVRPATV